MFYTFPLTLTTLLISFLYTLLFFAHISAHTYFGALLPPAGVEGDNTTHFPDFGVDEGLVKQQQQDRKERDNPRKWCWWSTFTPTGHS